MPIIKPRTDAENRQFIERCWWLSSTSRNDLLSKVGPQARAQWVRSHRVVKAVLLTIGSFLAASLLLVAVTPSDQRPVQRAMIQTHLHNVLPASTDASVDGGVITAVEMHDMPTSLESTITTTIGVFQVGGAVSAALGDKVTIKKTVGPITEEDACVASKIKTACYRLL